MLFGTRFMTSFTRTGIRATMNLEEMRQVERYARADAAEAKTRDARVEFAQATHPLAVTAESCERLERIEAAIRALGPDNAWMSVPSDARDDS